MPSGSSMKVVVSAHSQNLRSRLAKIYRSGSQAPAARQVRRRRSAVFVPPTNSASRWPAKRTTFCAGCRALWPEDKHYPTRDHHQGTRTVARAPASEHDLDVIIGRAAAAAKRAGQYSGALHEIVEASLDRVDGTLRSEASWSRPNRRYVQHGIFLPAWQRTGAGTVAFVLDTSASISAQELALYSGSLLGIFAVSSISALARASIASRLRVAAEHSFSPPSTGSRQMRPTQTSSLRYRSLSLRYAGSPNPRDVADPHARTVSAARRVRAREALTARNRDREQEHRHHRHIAYGHRYTERIESVLAAGAGASG